MPESPADRGRLELGLLGPLAVALDGVPVDVRGPRQRAILALLALHANRPVPRERLIDGVWGDDPPETAVNALQVAVHGLRRALGSDRIETRGDAYVLRLEPGELDLDRFSRLVERAGAQEGSAAAGTLRDALAVWRGEALADLRASPFAAAEARRLEELRLAALEARIEADLDAGRADLIAELEEVVAREPLRERFRRHLILAPYRAGRQAEALDAYREARRTLVDELGVEPGPELRRLEAAILRHDPELAPPVRVRPGARKPARRADRARRTGARARGRDRAAATARRAPRHPDRAGRDGQDAARARSRVGARPPTAGRRLLRRPRAPRRPGRRDRRDRPRAASRRGSGLDDRERRGDVARADAAAPARQL